MAPCKQREFPTEWTLWCEEDEERVRDRQPDESRAQEASGTIIAGEPLVLPPLCANRESESSLALDLQDGSPIQWTKHLPTTR
jgi:hypothetical protein